MKRPTVIPVTSAQDLQGWFAKSSKILLVLDLHQSWSGSCETLLPTCDGLMRNIPESEGRLVFLSVEIDDPTYLETVLDGGDDDVDHAGIVERLNLRTRGCDPLFVVVRDRKIVSVVEGLNPPSLIKAVMENIPKVLGVDDGAV